MSVAFRREGDDEHLEPKFELPIPPGPNLVTARGLTQIHGKVAELQAALAGLTEETQIAALKRDLRYWQTHQTTAKLMAQPDGSRVAFGTTVTFALKGQTRTISVVGYDEADPAEGLLAFFRATVSFNDGAEEGDCLDYGNNPDAIEILAIQVPKI